MRALSMARNHRFNSKCKSRITEVPKSLDTGRWKCTFIQGGVFALKTSSVLFSIETSIHPGSLRPVLEPVSTWPSPTLLATHYSPSFLPSVSLTPKPDTSDLQGQQVSQPCGSEHGAPGKCTAQRVRFCRTSRRLQTSVERGPWSP